MCGMLGTFTVLDPILSPSYYTFDATTSVLCMVMYCFGPIAAIISTTLMLLAGVFLQGGDFVLNLLYVSILGLLGGYALFRLKTNSERSTLVKLMHIWLYAVVVHVALLGVWYFGAYRTVEIFELWQVIVLLIGGYPVAILMSIFIVQYHDTSTGGHQKLSERVDELYSMLGSINGAVIVSDINEHIIRMNVNAELLLERRFAEVENLRVDEVISIKRPDSGEKVEMVSIDSANTKRIIDDEDDVVLVTRGGTEKNISTSITPIYSNNDKVIGLVRIITDTTKYYKIIQDLTKNEVIYRMRYKYAPLAYIILDLNGVIIDVNIMWQNLTGFDRGNSVGKKIDHFVIDFQQKCDVMASVKSLNQYISKQEEVILQSNIGKRIHVLLDMQAEFSTQGKVWRIYCIVRDITEETNKHTQLQAVNDMYKELADGVDTMLWITGKNVLPIYCNASLLKFTGRTMKEESAANLMNEVHRDDRIELDKLVKYSRENLKSYHTTVRIMRHDGKYRWMRIFGNPRRFSGNEESVGFVGSLQDITDQKEIELMLRDQANLQSMYVKYLTDAACYKRMDMKYDRCNDKYAEIAGKKIDEIIGYTGEEVWGEKYEEMNFLNDDKELIMSRKAVKTETVINGVRYESIKLPFFNQDGGLEGIIGILHPVA